MVGAAGFEPATSCPQSRKNKGTTRQQSVSHRHIARFKIVDKVLEPHKANAFALCI